MYRWILVLHLLGAAIWVGGHLILAFRFLPLALRLRSAAIIQGYEQRFEPIGIPALITQVLTGLWLAQHLVPPRMWFALTFVASWAITAKLTFLLMTILLALHARLWVIPRLRDDNLSSLAYHILAVTTLSVLFVIAGVTIRTGGLFS